MKSRREIIRSFALASIACPAVAAANEANNDDYECRKTAAKLASVLKASKGGEWKVSFDKEETFVLISRRLT